MRSPERLRPAELGVLLIGYVLLDWTSFIHPLNGLNITPWSPAAALGLTFAQRFGWRALVPLFIAIFAADLVIRDIPVGVPVLMLLAAQLALGYSAIGVVLRGQPGAGVRFEDRGALLTWVAIVMLGTLINSAAFVLSLITFGAMELGGWREALTRYWIGDAVGILVSMPLFAMLLDVRDRAVLRAAAARWEVLGWVAVTAGGLLVVFWLGEESEFKYFYVLFLPIVWAAARHGFAGAVLSAGMVQLQIIAAVQWLKFPTVTVLETQTLAVALALVGFFIGVVIDRQKRLGAELRHSLRLAAAGEMAGALAHELNQPLTAMAAYGVACEDLIGRGERGERLADMIARMVGESNRAAEVVHRLRDFFRSGSTSLETVLLDEFLARATAPFRARADRERVLLTVAPPPPVVLLADRLQLEVVIRNLLENAFQAVAGNPPGQRNVLVATEEEGADRICIRVEDNGPGIALGEAGLLFEPFRSTKSSGLGLGLAMSRSIVEAHGGRLWAEVGTHGLFKLSLPIEGGAADAAA